MTRSAPSARAMGTYFCAISTTPRASTLPSSQRLSQLTMGGGVKPMTAIFTGSSVGLPLASVVLTVRCRIT